MFSLKPDEVMIVGDPDDFASGLHQIVMDFLGQPVNQEMYYTLEANVNRYLDHWLNMHFISHRLHCKVSATVLVPAQLVFALFTEDGKLLMKETEPVTDPHSIDVAFFKETGEQVRIFHFQETMGRA